MYKYINFKITFLCLNKCNQEVITNEEPQQNQLIYSEIQNQINIKKSIIIYLLL